MNHQLAINTRATERYLLGELDDESRSAFEEHYFSCRACGEDVKSAATFVDNAKVVLAAGPVARSSPVVSIGKPMPWFGSRLAVPLALAACLLMGYLLPHPSSTVGLDGLVATATVPAGTRGASGSGQLIVLDQHASYFQVRLDVADDVTAPRLLWRVRTAGGRELSFQTVRENQATLPLRAADFPNGQYELVLSADTPGSKVIERYPFAIQHR